MALKLSVVPDKAVTVTRGKTVVAACWFGRWVRRPYVYPFLAPGDVEVTRLDHPGDPVSHSHHKSIWIGHANVGGVDFWSESNRAGHIAVAGVEPGATGGDQVDVTLACSWRKPDGGEVIREQRRLEFHELGGGALALDLDVRLEAPESTVELGVTNFGILGVRVARTIRVHEGLGGLIFNSNEAENETGCFGQHALWCDYSGPVPLRGRTLGTSPGDEGPRLASVTVGIACIDHPGNPGDDVLWHVRDDGWMGPGLTRAEPLSIAAGKPLRVRYRILSHAGRPWEAGLAEHASAWRRAATKR